MPHLREEYVVVAEQPIRILDLQEVHPWHRRQRGLDHDGFVDTVGEPAVLTAHVTQYSPSVHDKVGPFPNVPRADHHGGVETRQGREFLKSSLLLDRAQAPQGGLWVVDIHVDAKASGDGADEPTGGSERHQFCSGERFGIIIPLHVDAVDVLQRHRCSYRTVVVGGASRDPAADHIDLFRGQERPVLRHLAADDAAAPLQLVNEIAVLWIAGGHS